MIHGPYNVKLHELPFGYLTALDRTVLSRSLGLQTVNWTSQVFHKYPINYYA